MTSNALEQELKKHVQGDVRFDQIARRVYSVDASIYEVEPIGIVLPKDRADLQVALQIAYAHQIPVIPRGAATGITGGCLGKGLIIDTSKFLNQILEINYQEEFAICEPGVVQDVLNETLAKQNYRLGPDTSTGNRATLGGMVGNNAAGARSLRYGKMVDHVQELELLLADGEILSFAPCSPEEWKQKSLLLNAEGRIYRTIQQIQDNYETEIEKHFPKIPRRVSGYNLDELLKPPPHNICKLIVGAEGSLGIVSKIKVKISQRPMCTGMCVIHFDDMALAFHTVEQILAYHPLSLEMIDQQIIRMGRLSPTMQSQLGWLQGDPEAVFAVEFEGNTPSDVTAKLMQFEQIMRDKKIGYAYTILEKKSSIDQVLSVRKAGLELLLSKRSYSRAIAFIEDLSIPPQQLGSFMKEFLSLLKHVGKEAGIYGHVGSGCMHIRPYIDLRNTEEIQLMKTIVEQVSDLILKYGGAMSGEHGDGLVRSWLNKKMFGDKIYEAFCLLKQAFDPLNRMNPGKIVHGPPLTENLRLSPQIKQPKISTFLDFSSEGGFSLAVDLCNGNGQCRKRENIMCPSFQATGDEYDTTRARAQALRAVVNGHLPDLTHEGIHDVLDLCLECKGCKKECPSHVDMAKMKAEFLFHYQEKHGYSLRNKIFGKMDELYQWTSPFANRLSHSFISKLLFKWIGIAPERPPPLLASQKFSNWLKKQTKPRNDKKRVVLFNDTYNEYLCPEIGQAAWRVLTKLGYEVLVPKRSCCGRPLISKGMLKEARKKAQTLLETLLPYAKEGIPIIGLEPSCILTIMDDYKGLLGNVENLPCMTIDQFLYSEKLIFPETKKQVSVHGHCHQKAVVGMKPTLEVLRSIKGCDVHEIPSGCCGVAGSFGYEAEHYQISMKIGELVLLPAVRKLGKEDIVIANGISCRSQIQHGAGRASMHLIQFIDKILAQDL